MKKIILLILTVFASVYVFGQDPDTIPEEPSTYTTQRTETVTGSEGDPACNHEWFTTNFSTENETERKQSASNQCISCGKQYAIINIWTIREFENEE